MDPYVFGPTVCIQYEYTQCIQLAHILRMHVRMELFETEALHAIIGHIVALQI